MRKLIVCLGIIVVATVSGCLFGNDGDGSNCSSEIAAIIAQRGTPSDTTNVYDGDKFHRVVYRWNATTTGTKTATDSSVAFQAEWGSSLGGCQARTWRYLGIVNIPRIAATPCSTCP